MKRAIFFAIGGLVFLAGCNSKGNSAYTVHLQPKWQGAPYHIAFATEKVKPNPAGITIPTITYTANPDMLENRACLVVRFENSQTQKDPTMMNQMIMGPVTIHGAKGALPADYMESTDQGLARLLEAYHIKGKLKVSVLLAQSSLSAPAGNDEINQNRLSDWLPTELEFTSPHALR